MAYTNASNPPVHKIGNSSVSIFKFHVTRMTVNFNERLDCILKRELHLGDQRGCEEEKKSEKATVYFLIRKMEANDI